MSNTYSKPVVTFILTSYNQQDNIGRTIKSLPWNSDISWNAILVDDCSTDETVRFAQLAVEEYGANSHPFKIIKLQTNSGGPSKPRNTGIKAATGEYIFFLDGDDQLDTRYFDEAANTAINRNVDLLRLPMQIVLDGGNPRVVDIVDVSENDSSVDVLTKCVTQQSMGIMAFSRRQIIVDHNIEFETNVKMGEDLVFMAEFCRYAKNIWFSNTPLYMYLKSSQAGTSSTTSFSSEMFIQAIGSWDKVQERYLKAGVNFLSCHGAGSISYVLGQIQKYYVKPDRRSFKRFTDFCNKWQGSIELSKFGGPFQEIVEAALENDYEQFIQACKLRLLIAGHDLKFIKSAVPALEEYFQVVVDEWAAETKFDEDKTRGYLNWAQIVWAEWMTYAAEWFSKNCRPSQKLIVRCHFYELTRDSGFKMNQNRISAVVAIALHTYEDLIDKFMLPRTKVRLIPNYYAVDAYASRDKDWNPYSIAFIGPVPRRKGLHRALEILKRLREIDSLYTLTIFGKKANDFPWVINVEEERQYYDACDAFIAEHNLEDAVIYPGWSDIRQELSKFGCVLSTSDFEGSHVAPGEAFCAQIPMAILDWRGAKYVYPNEFIFDNLDDMVQSILAVRKSNYQFAGLSEGREFFRDHQDLPVFVEDVKDLIQSSKAIYEL